MSDLNDCFPYGIAGWDPEKFTQRIQVVDHRDGHVAATCDRLGVAVAVAVALNEETKRLGSVAEASD